MLLLIYTSHCDLEEKNLDRWDQWSSGLLAALSPKKVVRFNSSNLFRLAELPSPIRKTFSADSNRSHHLLYIF